MDILNSNNFVIIPIATLSFVTNRAVSISERLFLKTTGTEVFVGAGDMTVTEAYEAYKAGKLKKADRLLGKPVIYVVRDVPVINDVTMQDAIDSGLDTVAELISSGSSAPAIIPDLAEIAMLEES